MDQRGLKRNGNRDDSLTFLQTGAGVGRESGDTAGSLLQAAMHLPSGPAPLSQSTVASNGRGTTKDQGDLTGLYESPDICAFNMNNNLSLLNQSITDLDRTPTSIIHTSDSSALGNIPLPDLFGSHVKQEQDFSLHKDSGGYNTHPSSCDLDSTNAGLIDDSEIWEDLDLPGSLPEISDFELDSEVAHLDNILHDASSVISQMQGLQKETKPLTGNGGHFSNVNGKDQHHSSLDHHQHPDQHVLHQPQSLLSSVMIKEEKDDDSFIQICTPGVVKQEKKDTTSFCAPQCLQNSPLHGGPMSPNVGHGYQYRATPPSTVSLPDQKPLDIFPTLPQIGDSWARGGRYGESPGMQRSNNGTASMATYALNFPW